MNTADIVAALGTILSSGVLVEVIRSRRHAQKAAVEVKPNHGSSLRDAVDRIERSVESMRADLGKHGERLARLEAWQPRIERKDR